MSVRFPRRRRRRRRLQKMTTRRGETRRKTRYRRRGTREEDEGEIVAGRAVTEAMNDAMENIIDERHRRVVVVVRAEEKSIASL